MKYMQNAAGILLICNSLIVSLCSWLVLFQGNTMVFTYFNTLFTFTDLTLEELLLMPVFN